MFRLNFNPQFIFLIAFIYGINCLALTIQDLQPPLVVYHRAGMLNGGGNTLENFQESVSSPAEIIEMDLRSTRDGKSVVFHDPTLEDSTNCKGTIESQNWSDLKYCKYKKTNRKIATFEDAINTLIPQKIIDAEFKNIQAVQPALNIVKKYSIQRNVYFQTKNDPTVYNFSREQLPDVFLLFKAETEKDLNWVLQLNDPFLLFIELDNSMLNSNNIEKILNHKKWIRSNAWSFDLTKELFTAGCKKLFKLGVTAVHTNKDKSCFEQKKYYKSYH